MDLSTEELRLANDVAELQLQEAVRDGIKPYKDRKNFLKEAVLANKDMGQSGWEGMQNFASRNPLYQLMLKEGITSDIAGALGIMQSEVVKAAYPALTGRELIWTMPTEDALVRFPKATKSKAYQKGESSQIWMTGEKYATTDITLNIEIKSGGEWTRKFLEDAKWNVMQRQAWEIGRAVGQAETQAIYDYLVANAGTSGSSKGAISWANVVAMWADLKKLDWVPNVIALDPGDIATLWSDDKFIHQFYFGGMVDVARGVLGSSYLGMKIVTSSLFTNHTYLCLDSSVAAVMPIRRELMVEPFENPREDRYGIVATERIGLGALRTTAINKYTY